MSNKFAHSLKVFFMKSSRISITYSRLKLVVERFVVSYHNRNSILKCNFSWNTNPWLDVLKMIAYPSISSFQLLKEMAGMLTLPKFTDLMGGTKAKELLNDINSIYRNAGNTLIGNETFYF